MQAVHQDYSVEGAYLSSRPHYRKAGQQRIRQTYDICKADDEANFCGTAGAKAAAVAKRDVTQKAVNFMVVVCFYESLLERFVVSVNDRNDCDELLEGEELLRDDDLRLKNIGAPRILNDRQPLVVMSVRDASIGSITTLHVARCTCRKGFRNFTLDVRTGNQAVLVFRISVLQSAVDSRQASLCDTRNEKRETSTCEKMLGSRKTNVNQTFQFSQCICLHFINKITYSQQSNMKKPKARTHPSFSAQRGLLLSMLVLSSVSARDLKKYGPWNMPSSVVSQGHSFLSECESLAAFFWKVRGGANQDYYYDDRGRYYDDDEPDEYYDDYKKRSNQRRKGPAFLSNMPSVIKNGDRRIGFGLLGSGSIITMLGISLFFNKTLMRLGNLLFIAGVPMTLGPSRTLGYFVKPEKFRATGCLALGIFLVFIGMPVFGIILEAFGILNLFGNLFPFVWAVAKNMPGIGPLLSGGNNRKRREPKRDEYSYEDDYGRDEDPYYGDRRPPSRDSRYY
jgi:hypothetical protein